MPFFTGDRGKYAELDVVAMDRETYQTGLLRILVNITTTQRAGRAVKLKVDNLNLEDLFDSHRLRNLKAIFKQTLWPESQIDLHLSFLASALDEGDNSNSVIPTCFMKKGKMVHY